MALHREADEEQDAGDHVVDQGNTWDTPAKVAVQKLSHAEGRDFGHAGLGGHDRMGQTGDLKWSKL